MMKKSISLLTVGLVGLVVAAIFEYGYNFAEQVVAQVNIISIFLRILVTLVVLVVFFWIILKSENPYVKIPWLLALAINPLFGAFLFLSFARDFKSSSRYRKRKLMHDYGYLVHEPETDLSAAEYQSLDKDHLQIFQTSFGLGKHHIFANDSKVHVLTNGDEKFPALKRELLKAKDYIFMQYYILKTDETAREVLEILKAKVKQGVEVRLLYDAFGAYYADTTFIKSLKKAGIQVEIIDRVWNPVLNTRINYRNHRKVTVIDGQVGFTGGLNLGDEYIHKNPYFGFWRDTHLTLTGRVVNSLLAVFVKDWYYATGEFLDDPRYYCARPVNASGYVQVLQSGPDSTQPVIRNTYLKMIAQATYSVKIMSPYLIPDQEIMSALKTAAASGVRVQIIVPGKPDKKIVYTVTESYFAPLIKAGVQLYYYPDVFTHAKVLIIDDEIASCGTVNMDVRSFQLNFEDTVLFKSDAVDKLVADFEHDLAQCVEITLESWRHRSALRKITEGVLSIAAPLM
ncbi:MAG: cardiolipin synthase [candidate division KSB1 bacterium]|nr:cardiolipin synthase [candidate division KSB1 bacterium]